MKQFFNKREDYYTTPMREFPLLSKLFLMIVFAVVTPITKLLWRWTVDGKGRMFETSGKTGNVVIMNHTSMLDPVLVVMTFLAHGKRIRPIYRSEFDRFRIVGWFLTQVGGIPIKRGTADMRAIRAAKSALLAGESVLIYPEGTRIRDPHAEREIHGGFALIASMAEADIIPSAIVGATDIKPNKLPFLRPVRVWLRVGERIHVGHIGRKERKEKLAELEDEAITSMFAIRDELMSEHPGRV